MTDKKDWRYESLTDEEYALYTLQNPPKPTWQLTLGESPHRTVIPVYGNFNWVQRRMIKVFFGADVERCDQ